jgi:acyl carrier protein
VTVAREAVAESDESALCRQAVQIVLALAPEQAVQSDASTRLVDDLGYDSLRLLELTIALEEHFHVRASREDTEDVHALGDVEALVRRLAKSGELAQE